MKSGEGQRGVKRGEGQRGVKGGRGRGGSAWTPRQGLTFQDRTDVPYVLVTEGGELLHHTDLLGKLLQEISRHEGGFAGEDNLLRRKQEHCLRRGAWRPSRPRFLCPLGTWPAPWRPVPGDDAPRFTAETRQAPVVLHMPPAYTHSGTLSGGAVRPLEISEPSPREGEFRRHVGVYAPKDAFYKRGGFSQPGPISLFSS